jgi:ATP-dependent DNA helicase PIF1
MPPHPALTDILVKFHEAAEALGLIDGDNSWDDSLKEATIWAMPPSIRRLFATIFVFGEPSNVRGLSDKHLEAMPINTKVICNNIGVW